MTEATTTIQLASKITLRDEGGDALTLAVGEIREQGGRVQMEAQVTPEVWSRVVEASLFGLVDEALPTGGPEQLDPERSVYLRLRLHAGMPEGLTILEIVQQLTTEEGEASLEDAWVICEAMQEVELPEGMEGSAQAGFRTTWAEAEGEGEESPLTAHVISWLSEVGAEVQVVQPDLLRVPMEHEGAQWVLLVRIDPDVQIVGFYSIFPALVPEDALAMAAVFFMGQNFDLPFGGFEMDPEDGELRFRTAWAGGADELPTGAQLYELVAPHAPLMSAHMGAFDELISED